MNDLSLAVAQIIMPEYEWETSDFYVDKRAVARVNGSSLVREDFDYKTDKALGKMCVWLAKHYGKREMWMDVGVIGHWLEREENPHKALAEAIVRTNET